jgi:hypothetical protein
MRRDRGSNQNFIDRKTGLGKIRFKSLEERWWAMKTPILEDKKVGKKPEFKKRGTPIAFGMP